MTFEEVMGELESLGNLRTKKMYLGNGVQEPLFGVATGAMKPLLRKINHSAPKGRRGDQALAEKLYATGNYDAMYFAGMIADPLAMSEGNFDRWMETAYCFMLADFVAAVTLAEADCVQSVACRWIESDRERHRSAGWSCYQWLLGWRPDGFFDPEKIRALLDWAVKTAPGQSEHLRGVMGYFVAAVGVSFLPLHDEAFNAAGAAFPSALEAIQKAKDKGRLGFKRKAVRC